MKYIYILIFTLILNNCLLFGEEQDSLKTYKTKEIEVIEKRNFNFEHSYLYSPDYQSLIFSKDGMNLIRRGGGLTQDFYSEGFKRNDIAITLDGEAIQCACPNRMDAPITRVNIVEIESIKLARTSSSSNSSLYGKIEFQRKELGEDFRFRSMISGNLLSQNEYDVQLFGEGKRTGIVARYSLGNPYKDAEGNDFESLYGFSSIPNFNYWSFSLRHAFTDLEAGISASGSKDVLFPYLRMDERETFFLSGFASFKKNKFYINYTSHLMDNGLRKTLSSMEMETDAKNLTLGLTGENYNIIVRNWKADNFILSKMNSMRVDNFALPNVLEISATGNFGFDLGYAFLNTRLGLAYSGFSDDSALNIFKLYNPESEKSRVFIIGALNLSRNFELSNEISVSVSGEISTFAPGAEQLFISLRRLMQNPNWFGNPDLKQTIKSNLRFNLLFAEFFSVGLNGNYIWNYVNPSADTVLGQKPRMTYKNIDAIIANSFIGIKYEWFETQLNFTWGENQKTNEPLAEIAPLSIISSISFPKLLGIGLIFYHQWENVQKRIDSKLLELTSESWNIIGISLDYNLSPFKFVVGIDNLLNHKFSRYLSTARDPYSAGVRVFEPGRSISLRIMVDKGF